MCILERVCVCAVGGGAFGRQPYVYHSRTHDQPTYPPDARLDLLRLGAGHAQQQLLVVLEPNPLVLRQERRLLAEAVLFLCVCVCVYGCGWA